MKALLNKKSILFTALVLCISTGRAQWKAEASGFPVPNRGTEIVTAVNDRVAWASNFDGSCTLCDYLAEFTRTPDGGKHWIPGRIKAATDQFITDLEPLSGTTAYATTADFYNYDLAEIFKTIDGGATWQRQLSLHYANTGDAGDIDAIHFFNNTDGITFADPIGGYFTIYTTHNGGTTWTRVPQSGTLNSFSGEYGRTNVKAAVGNTFLTLTNFGRLFKSTDRGLHWQVYQTPISGSAVFVNIRMRDENNGLMGADDTLYRTTDGGVTWKKVKPRGTWFTCYLSYVPFTAASWVSTGGHNFFGYGAQHGIGSSYSVDDGKTWTTIDTAVEHLGVAMVNPVTGFSGGFNVDRVTKGMFKYDGHPIGTLNKSLDDETLSATTGDKGLSLALNIFPNPASNSATISFLLSQLQKASIQIFDADGRLIKTVTDAEMQPGAHQIIWNVKDEKGNAVATGIYLLKMQAGNYVETKKISVVK